jgi:hypothetical protein
MLESPQSSVGRVTRPLAVSVYAFYCLAGVCGSGALLWKHGISQPEQVVVAFLMVLLSLTWLGTTLGSGPPTRRRFGSHASFLLLLTGVSSFASLLRK